MTSGNDDDDTDGKISFTCQMDDVDMATATPMINRSANLCITCAVK